MSDGTFEAFRKAEALLARRQPLDALRALEPVLEHEPNTPSVQLLAARAYFASAQLNRAEAAFRRVVELDPTDHYARFALGKTLHRQGRLQDAVTQLRIAVAMLPSPDYQEALNEVRARIAVENSN
ncbi:tetratricopeptide repeat protein [Allokutzneria oryzae]|uniref:Tetratricopeptide repeat protein n=1 Tax=Allokutzneria oryzae TaxID=1378989 RepID=A0ABV6A251_9PSEU